MRASIVYALMNVYTIDAKWVWEKLKEALTSDQILDLQDLSKPVVQQTDSSTKVLRD